MKSKDAMDIDRALEVDGWMSPANLKWLAEHAGACEYIAELGIYCGRSTVAMLDNSDAHLWCVDTWNYGKCAARNLEIFRQNIAGREDRVTILHMTTHEAAQKLARAEMRFDMVFIDACHKYGVVKQDILDYRPLVRRGGLLAGHDYKASKPEWDVTRAVNELIPDVRRFRSSIWWKRL